MGKVLFLGAHPDDETFLPGATLAKYADLGHEIHVVSATRGEAGVWSDVKPNGKSLGEIREIEHRKAANTLGIKMIEYLDYVDGTLANKNIDTLVTKLKEIAEKINPDVIITLDLLGISGHIDHIVVSLATTKMFHEMADIKKLYYFVLPEKVTNEIFNTSGRKVWGRPENEITTTINVEKWISNKVEAAKCHQTQMRDVERLIPRWLTYKYDCFVLSGSRVESKFPEEDLFSGI